MDELDRLFCHPVFRGGLPRKNTRPWDGQRRLVCDHTQIHRDDVQHIEGLPFVFMDAFDVNIKERVRADNDSGSIPNDLGQAELVGPLNRHEVLLEPGIVGIGFEPPELVQIGDPAIPNGRCDEIGQLRIGLQEPTAWRSISFVVKALRPQLIEVWHQRGLHQSGMEFRDPIDGMAPHNGEIGPSAPVYSPLMIAPQSRQNITLYAPPRPVAAFVSWKFLLALPWSTPVARTA